jgi:hypothetical protein
VRGRQPPIQWIKFVGSDLLPVCRDWPFRHFLDYVHIGCGPWTPLFTEQCAAQEIVVGLYLRKLNAEGPGRGGVCVQSSSMSSSHPVATRRLRFTLGWTLLPIFVGMIAIWTSFGFAPKLAEVSPEPLAAFGRIREFWPICAGFVAGGGAAWALAPGLTIRGQDEGESRVGLSPLAAALLGPSSLIMMFASYWPCAGSQNPVWASLRYALEALEGYVAEPFGVTQGCPTEFPQVLLVGVLFGKTTLALVVGLGFAYVFRHSIDTVRAHFARQVVVFSGLDSESVNAARVLRRSLTRRQRLLLLDAGPELARAREVARETHSIALSIDVTDAAAVEAFMRARGRRGIQGLYLMSSDAGANIRAMELFLKWQEVISQDQRAGRGVESSDQDSQVAARAQLQRKLLEMHSNASGWRAPKRLSGLSSRAGLARTEVPGRVVVRVDNPWHAEDWRRRQMIARTGWLFEAVSTNQIAARHVVRQAMDEEIEEIVLLGSTPFELAVLSEIAFERRSDHALEVASMLGKQRWGAASKEYKPATPSVVLLGDDARDAADHFRQQLIRFGITDADRHIRVEHGTAQELMERTDKRRAMVLNETPGYDSTFIAVRYPRWRIFEWVPEARGLTAKPMLGGLSLVGPTLDPVGRFGVDIWERLGRIQHEMYLYLWHGGTPSTGDSKRGTWDRDLDAFAKESNIRSFAAFCRAVASLGRQWATDLGAGGSQSEHPLLPDEIERVAILEHESWVRHHVEYGWRLGDADGSGGGRDRDKVKLHPNLVEWDALSTPDKQKDFDNVTSITTLMRSLGFILVDNSSAHDMIYERVPRRVTAVLLKVPWNWTTSKSDTVSAKEGDYRITDAESGAQWSVSPEALIAGYRHVGDDAYEACGRVEARQVASDAQPEVVASLEGLEQASPGDWIVADAQGNNWVVDVAYFHRNYRTVRRSVGP